MTDMTGAQFNYSVASIRRADAAPTEMLLDGSGELTLFVRDSYSLQYIIVRCQSDAATY